VEREEEDLSESEVVEEEIITGVSEMSVQSNQSGGSVRGSKKDLHHRVSFTHEDQHSSSPPKRALDAMWPGIFRKGTGSKKF
jgi:hypothetical protein